MLKSNSLNVRLSVIAIFHVSELIWFVFIFFVFRLFLALLFLPPYLYMPLFAGTATKYNKFNLVFFYWIVTTRRGSPKLTSMLQL